MILLVTFFGIGLYQLVFVDDLFYSRNTWLSKRNGILHMYFLVSIFIMKTSNLMSGYLIDYRHQIVMNFVLKSVCLICLTIFRPIFRKEEHVICCALGIFNLWISICQVLRLVSESN